MEDIERGDTYPVALVRAVIYTDGDGNTQEVRINIMEDDGTSQTLVSKVFEMVKVKTTVLRDSETWAIHQ